MQRLRESAEAVRLALRSKWALHPLLLLTLVPILFIAEAQYDYARVSAGSAIPILASVIAAEAVLVCGSVISFAFPRPTVRAVVAVASYVLAGAARAVVIVVWSNSGVAVAVPPAQRVIQSILFIGCVSMSFAVVLNRSAAYRRIRAQLASSQLDLEATRLRNQHQLDLARAQLSQVTTSQLTPELAQIRDRVASLTGGPDDASTAAQLADAIADTNADLVRPLSHAIADESPSGPPPGAEANETDTDDTAGARSVDDTGSRIWDRNLLREASIISPLQPVPTVVIATLMRLAIVLQVIRYWPLEILSLAALGVSLAAFKRLLPGSFVQWRTGSRIALLLGCYVAAGLLMLVPATWTNPDVALEVQLRWAVLQVIVVVSICVVLATSAAALYRLRSDLAARAAVNASLRWENGRLEDSIAHEQRQISHFVHTDIQGLLAIAAVKLRGFATGGSTSDLEDARRATDRAYEQTLALSETTAEPMSSVDLRVGLDSIANAWGALLSVTITARAAELEELNAIPSVAEAIMNVVTETIANAARHGSARRVEIDVRRDGTITAVDDGTGPRGKVIAGLTAAQLLRDGGQWSIEPGPHGGSIVQARVPTGLTPD